MDIDLTQTCPECGGTFKFTTEDAAEGRTVQCSGGHPIKLENPDGSMGKAGQSLKDLDKTIEDVNRKLKG